LNKELAELRHLADAKIAALRDRLGNVSDDKRELPVWKDLQDYLSGKKK
jgi:hypothetical protein